MKTREALAIWDKAFPAAATKHLYPQPWVISMWCWKYSAQELEYAALSAQRAINDDRLKHPTIDEATQYMSGVMRQRRNDNARVAAEIAEHIAEKAEQVKAEQAVADVEA